MSFRHVRSPPAPKMTNTVGSGRLCLSTVGPPGSNPSGAAYVPRPGLARRSPRRRPVRLQVSEQIAELVFGHLVEQLLGHQRHARGLERLDPFAFEDGLVILGV